MPFNRWIYSSILIKKKIIKIVEIGNFLLFKTKCQENYKQKQQEGEKNANNSMGRQKRQVTWDTQY